MYKSMLIAFVMMITAHSPALAQDTDEVWNSLRSYDGVWFSETRIGQDGNPYQFRYTLYPFDNGGLIVQMTIEMLVEDQPDTLLWSGFKGWDSIDQTVFYHAVSPGGRFADGDVIINADGHLETRYRGVSLQQGENHIRDVFTPIIDDQFAAITYLLRDGNWVEVWRDEWVRAES